MLKLKIITKNKTVESNLEAKNITIPTPLGPAGILNNHDDMILLLDLGIADVECANNERRKYLIKNGVCKILDNRITLLCDNCETKEEIDIKQAIVDKEKYQKIVEQMNIRSDEYQDAYKKLKEAKLKIMMFEK
ncbi:ATP synthase F1 subunit epsilon [Candidatus Woesearchaeota archaeon]|nr:ATP synthase F1 subunit epsilon [Candidatus Woesearchaeota archaeon]